MDLTRDDSGFVGGWVAIGEEFQGVDRGSWIRAFLREVAGEFRERDSSSRLRRFTG